MGRVGAHLAVQSSVAYLVYASLLFRADLGHQGRIKTAGPPWAICSSLVACVPCVRGAPLSRQPGAPQRGLPARMGVGARRSSFRAPCLARSAQNRGGWRAPHLGVQSSVAYLVYASLLFRADLGRQGRIKTAGPPRAICPSLVARGTLPRQIGSDPLPRTNRFCSGAPFRCLAWGPRVQTALICLGRSAEPRKLARFANMVRFAAAVEPGRGRRAAKTGPTDVLIGCKGRFSDTSVSLVCLALLTGYRPTVSYWQI